MGIVDQLLNLPLRAIIAMRSHAFLLHESRPDLQTIEATDDETLRVLIVGAGLAMGYGVANESRALPGQLSSALSSRLGREVSVATHARPFLDLRAIVASLEPEGARQYDVVVFAPCFTEMTRAADLEWRRSAFELVAFLDRTGGPSVQIVLAGLPVPTRNGPLERIARRGIRAANHALADVASTYRRAVFVAVPPFARLSLTGSNFDERYYLRCADLVADAVVPTLAGI